MRLGEGHPNGAPRRRAARLGRTAPRREGPKGRQAAHQEAEPSGLARGSTRCHPARPGPPDATPRADARRALHQAAAAAGAAPRGGHALHQAAAAAGAVLGRTRGARG